MLERLQDFRRHDREFQRTGVYPAPPDAAPAVRKYMYRVPWSVPAWGWDEARVTAASLLSHGAAAGPAPVELAEAVRKHLGKRYALPAGRGRIGIEVVLRAAGVAGHEVVLPSYVCSAVLESTLRAGAIPVYADIEGDLHVSAATVRAVLTSRTRCVIVPHHFGAAAPIDQIEALLRGTGILLLDDAAQSFGAVRAGRNLGSFGDAGVVSVGVLKALSGPAGAVVVTDDAALYESIRDVPLRPLAGRAVLKQAALFWTRRFRRWTWPLYLAYERAAGMRVEQPYLPDSMANLNARIGLAQFRNLARNAEKRRRHARVLLDALAGLGVRSVFPLSRDHMLLQLAVLLPEEGPAAPEALAILAEGGVEARMSLLPCHYTEGGERADLPNTEAVWRRVLCLPLETPLKRPERLVRAVARWADSHARRAGMR